MRACRVLHCLALVVVLEAAALCAPFVVFPNAGQLLSPDGRLVVRNTNRNVPLSEFAGNFHTLFLEETASGHSRKLFNYVGLAAVGWANNRFIIVTEYLNRQTSRALVFVADGSRDPLVIDKPFLTSLVPSALRPKLRENDHVFVEATQVEGETLTLRVWGYGKHDAQGFRLHCEFSLEEGGISCQESTH